MGDRAKELSDVKGVIQALLVLHNRRPLRYATLMQDYQTLQDRPVPYMRLGFPDCPTNGLTFLESLHDMVRAQRTGSDVLISARKGTSVRRTVQAQQAREFARSPVSYRTRELPRPPQVSKAVKENIREVMGQGDMHTRVLEDTCCRRFGTTLDVRRYGLDSLEDYLAQIRMATENEAVLPEAIVAAMEQYPDGIFMSRFAEAYTRERGRPPTSRTVQLLSGWAQLFRAQKPDSPADFILQPASYSTAVLQPPEPLPARSSMRVTDVRGCPAVLTVTLQAPESESLLALLGAAMTDFYGPLAFGPPFNAEPGCACAALCAETWRRAHVVTVSGDLVQVELVDVGERRSLAQHLLRPLESRFTELPALCTMATLAPPPGRRSWREAAVGRLRELTQGCQLTCLFDGTRLELLDEHGLLLTRQLALEGLCKAAWQHVTLSDKMSFNIVWVEEQRYIFSHDLSRLLGRYDDSALDELQRRGIRFQCVRLCRNSAPWSTLWPLLGRSDDTVYYLFPADNIPDAVNLFCYPHTEVGIEVKRELAQLQDS